MLDGIRSTEVRFGASTILESASSSKEVLTRPDLKSSFIALLAFFTIQSHDGHEILVRDRRILLIEVGI